LTKKYIAFLGDEGVGKYSYILKLDKNDHINLEKLFTDEEFITDDIDYHSTIDENIGNFFTLKLDDSSDLIIFRIDQTFYKNNSIASLYLRKCNSIALFYDITNQASFDSLDKYINIIQEEFPENSPQITLVGTYNDEKDKRKIEPETVQEKVSNMAIKIYRDHREIKTIEIEIKRPTKKTNNLSPLNMEKDTRKQPSQKNKYWPIIAVMFTGGIIGGCGGYYGGRALAQHNDKTLIITLFTILGAILM